MSRALSMILKGVAEFMIYQVKRTERMGSDNGDQASKTGFSIPFLSPNTSSSPLVPSLEINEYYQKRIETLEAKVSELQSEIEDLVRPSGDIEIFDIVEVTLEDAKKRIQKMLRGRKGVLYLSDIIEETHMDPEVVFEAYKELEKAGKIKKV